ncbi:hypothetical protein GWI33_016271 [Rhynchophorus ferrugineus]|uniref:Uncharacterized protein n=1 Tax=Rhynchophorus ferrugineus TaxID=354439 RepID=A0A834M8U5_RHYFE|nr:hypothetical protein GWI33_016271 [Rhynchophorus ferrugineus]
MRKRRNLHAINPNPLDESFPTHFLLIVLIEHRTLARYAWQALGPTPDVTLGRRLGFRREFQGLTPAYSATH